MSRHSRHQRGRIYSSTPSPRGKPATRGNIGNRRAVSDSEESYFSPRRRSSGEDRRDRGYRARHREKRSWKSVSRDRSRARSKSNKRRNSYYSSDDEREPMKRHDRERESGGYENAGGWARYGEHSGEHRDRRRRGRRRDEGRRLENKVNGSSPSQFDDIYKGQQEIRTFQWGRFSNVLQILLFGWVRRAKPESKNHTVKYPCLYTDLLSNKAALTEQKKIDVGDHRIKLLNKSLQNGCVAKIIFQLTVVLPILDLLFDVVSLCYMMQAMPVFLIGLISLVYTFRNALIGYFMLACYKYPLMVNSHTIKIVLVPAYWTILSFVGHPFTYQIELAAWISGFILWPSRLAIQCWIALLEIRKGGKLGQNFTDLLQMGYVNAIGRPVPMFLIKIFAYSRGLLPLIPFATSSLLGLMNFFFIWLQYKTNGAECGVKLTRNRNLVKPKQIVPFKMSTAISAVAWSPDGKTVLIGMENGSLQILEAEALKKGERGRPLWSCEMHTKTVSDACFSTSGHYAVTTGYDGIVNVWQTHVGKRNMKWKLIKDHNLHRDEIHTCSISSDERFIASGGRDGELVCWEWDTHGGKYADEECLFKKVGKRELVVMVGFDPKVERVVVGGDLGTIKVLSLCEKSFGSEVASFSMKGTRLNCGVCGIFSAVDAKKHEEVDIWVACVCSTVLSSDGKKKLGRLQVLDLSQGKIITEMTMLHQNPIGFVAIFKDKSHCISSATSCKIWNMYKGIVVGHGQVTVRTQAEVAGLRATCGATSPDGRWVALGSNAGVFSLFDFKNKMIPPVVRKNV